MIDLAQATPRPWAVFHDHPDAETAADLASIRRAESSRHTHEVAYVYVTTTPRHAADAALIVRAVNEHDELIEIIRALTAPNDGTDDIGHMMRYGQAADAARAVLTRLDAQ